MVPSRRTALRPARAAGALALTLALAGAAAGCGSDGGGDDPTTAASTAAGGASTAASTAVGGATTTAASGGSAPTGGAPAANEAAIRAALRRSPASTTAAGTARIEVSQSTIGITTQATGTVDLVERRYLMDQTVGEAGGSDSTRFQNYGEKDKVYLQLPGAKTWSVTDNPAATSDPLAQVRQLEKATITKVGGTKEYGGRTCREFDATLTLSQVLGAIDDPSIKGLLSKAPAGAKVPVSSCIDDQGLSYATSSSYDLKEVLGAAGAQLPAGRSTSKVLVTDYGTAPSPKRPAGIDDAKAIGATTATTPTVATP